MTNPWGTQQIANDMLAQISGYKYRPFEAQDAILSDDADIGDVVTMSDVYGVIVKQEVVFDGLGTTSISAPKGDETDNEFGDYTSRSERAIARAFNGVRTRFVVERGKIEATIEDVERGLSSRITQTAESITAEVTRATAAEGQLSSRITQTAESITSEVQRATAAEGNLSSRITQTAESITAEAQRIDALGNKLSTTVSLDASGIMISNATGRKFVINTENNISMSFSNLTDHQQKQLEINAANNLAASAKSTADGAVASVSELDLALTALKTGIGYTYLDEKYVISPNIVGGSLVSESTRSQQGYAGTRVKIENGEIKFGYFKNIDYNVKMYKDTDKWLIMSDIYSLEMSTISQIILDANNGLVLSGNIYGDTLLPNSYASRGRIYFVKG